MISVNIRALDGGYIVDWHQETPQPMVGVQYPYCPQSTQKVFTSLEKALDYAEELFGKAECK